MYKQGEGGYLLCVGAKTKIVKLFTANKTVPVQKTGICFVFYPQTKTMYLLTVPVGAIIVTILVILVLVAIVIGIFALFEWLTKKPIPQTIKGVIVFIVVALLIIVAIQNHGISLW